MGQCELSPISCPVCKEVCLHEPKSYKEQSIGCDKSEYWYHLLCVNLNGSERCVVSEMAKWVCNGCQKSKKSRKFSWSALNGHAFIQAIKE